MYENQDSITANVIEESYQRLANGIVLRAVKDYRCALRKLDRYLYSEKATHQKSEVERFFRSEWYELLTSVDPKMLIARLNEEVAK